MEEWSYFIGNIQDNDAPLDSVLNHNTAIQEVYKMLKTFTKDDRLREQYRLHEEFLRVQSTERELSKKLKQDYLFTTNAYKKEKEERKAALKEKETALKEKETALKEKETTLKEKETALKEKEAAIELTNKSIAFMQKKGSSPEEIAEILNIPISRIMKTRL
ncbi:hypothetical protein MTBBW1_880007 [Desulfamplus magnetovallimortis]|uniref:Uncharacterized protein n=1 Tax=Desulfamplus magnetovallimortis TaxID=1246637 RepID=A0A1W1HKW1_9BACT|nr:hypothetical protein MTBBW1_880007 [Desulfamplus magnetovallimortis]